MTGTFINAAGVLAGGSLGVILGKKFPERAKNIIMDVIGLVTIVIGLQMAGKSANILFPLGSLLIGGVIGEVADLDGKLAAMACKLEQRLGSIANHSSDVSNGRFAKGFLTASLLFCVGPMAIMGSIQDGLTGDLSTLAIKAVLDGFSSLAFASSLGIGVLFSAGPILLYQGAITLAAYWVKTFLNEAMIIEMTAVGGLLILAIGLGLLNLKNIKVANLLPAIAVAPVIVFVASMFK